jgi:hypothetical protein
MSTPLKRLVTTVAGVFGYVRLPPQALEALRSIDGDFAPSPRERIGHFVTIAALIAVAALLLGLALRAYVRFPEPRSVLLGIPGITGMAVALVLWRRRSLTYRFTLDTIAAIGPGGTTLWSQTRSGLEAVFATNGKSGVFLTLVWPGRKRRLEYHDALRDRLELWSERV